MRPQTVASISSETRPSFSAASAGSSSASSGLSTGSSPSTGAAASAAAMAAIPFITHDGAAFKVNAAAEAKLTGLKGPGVCAVGG